MVAVLVDDADSLLQNIYAIRRALESCRRSVQQIAERLAPQKCDLARFFLYSDLSEAETLLSLIYKTTHTLRDITARQLERIKTLTPGESQSREIDPGSEEGILWQQRLELTPELTVLTKALYEWLYHIREDIVGEPTLKAAIPATLLSQLERYCTFRNKLVTHKTGRKVLASGGIRYTHNFSKFEILLVPVGGLPESAVKCLAVLYEQARLHLDVTEASEENIFERMAVLYRRLDRFPGELQGRMKTFLEHYGTISDTPSDLAAFLAQFVAVMTPHLGSNDGTGRCDS